MHAADRLRRRLMHNVGPTKPVSKSQKDLAKKERERFFLDCLIDSLADSLTVIEDREEPDFVVADEYGELGLELAEVFNDREEVRSGGKLHSPGKGEESRRSRFLQKLAETYYAKGGRPLHVQALLPDGFDSDVDLLVEQLISARPSEPRARGGFSLAHNARFGLLSLPDEFGAYSRWVAINNSVGWRRQDRLDDLQAIVRSKSSMLDKYRLVRPRLGLLLHADGTRSSGMISWSEEWAPIDACGFDQIYLHIHPSQAWRLV